MARRYLLAIDGGGIRGIIPVVALAKLEATKGELAQETFAFAGGTSTGAIISAGIAAGIPMERILDLYTSRSAEIFRKRPWGTLRRIVRGSMYSSATLHRVLSEELGDKRDWRLNQSPIDLLITAKRVSDGLPWYFVKDNPRNSGRTGRLGLVDCVVASAAAPTYFDPWTVREAGGPGIGPLVDGGVGVAGNPVYQSCVEAFLFSEGYDPAETTVISMGTGRFLKEKRPSWLWPWLGWLLGELLRSPGEQQTELVQRHFDQARFYRIDPLLEKDIPLDGADQVEELRRIGERLSEGIDWQAILDGTDTKFLVEERKTLYPQYSQAVS